MFGGLFGKSDNRRREQTEQEREDELIRMKAYHDAKQKQRIKNAKLKGIADANKLANHKPFYQKVGGFAVQLSKDFASNPDEKMRFLIGDFDEPTKKSKRRKRK